MRVMIILFLIACLAFPALGAKVSSVTGLDRWQLKVNQLIGEQFGVPDPSASSPTKESQLFERFLATVLPETQPARNKIPQPNFGDQICQQTDKETELECLRSMLQSISYSNASDNPSRE